MDDKSKQASSFQIDQEILDARGIDMTVEEVAGLSTVRYSEKVQNLGLNDDDLAFLKGLRRRIKNRLASQNSRRRNMEHLRRLARELRVVRACKGDAVAERKQLMDQRETLKRRCRQLREHVEKILIERSDTTAVPSIEITIKQEPQRKIKESQTGNAKEEPVKKVSVTETKLPILTECLLRDQQEKIFGCRIEKLVQQTVNHVFKAENTKLLGNEKPKKICAKTVFIANGLTDSSDVNRTNAEGDFKEAFSDDSSGVLNLSVKQENGRRSHGRKQSAPRRIAYAFCDNDESVLDLKIKKETQ